MNLDQLWASATKNVPLADAYLDNYIRKAPPPTSVPGNGSGVGLAMRRNPPRAARAPKRARAQETSQTNFLPIVPVSPADASEIYRRRSFLLRYIKSHDAFLALRTRKPGELLRNEPESAVSDDKVRSYARQAAGAHLELYLIERIAFGEGDTQAAKCAARERANGHALQLRLDHSGEQGRLSDGDFPPGWTALWTFAQENYAKNHAPFDPALCTVAQVITQKQVRNKLEGVLNVRLEKALNEQFVNAQKELEPFQKQLAQAEKDSVVEVPSRAIAEMRRATEDAKALYRVVADDDLKLLSEVAELTKAANELEAGQASPAGVFDPAKKSAQDQRDKLAALVNAASELGSIENLRSADHAALSGCTHLPRNLAVGQADAALVSKLDACVRAALGVRQRLLDAQVSHPGRVALMGMIQSLGSAYLIVNAPPR